MAPRSVATTFTAWGELDVESSDITAEIRMAVLGEWVPPQLADVLALQRAEEPETHAVLAGWTDPGRGAELPGDGFDFALSMIKLRGFGGKTQFWEHNLESFTLMAGLAAVTDRIKIFATAATLTLPPAIVARMAATIDSIAPGRF
eukprot:gene57818-79222_t